MALYPQILPQVSHPLKQAIVFHSMVTMVLFIIILTLVLPSEPPKSLLESLLDQFKDHLVQILLLSAFISFLLASSDYYYSDTGTTHSMSVFVEPFVILIILAVNATVGIMQESQAEQAINVYPRFPSSSSSFRH